MTEQTLTIPDIRRQYPQYNDLSDQQLADSLYQRHYSDMPRLQFDRRINAPIQGIDWNRPVEEVRADVGRLPPEDRPRALRQWAEAHVARERAVPGRHNEDFIRNFARGTFVGPWLDELNAATTGAAHSLTGGRIGSPQDEALAYQRAQDRAIDRENPILSPVTQLAGGVSGGFGGMAVRGPMMAARTLPGQIAQGAAVVGPAHAFSYGAGTSEGDAGERLQAGLDAVPFGVAAGGLIPPAVAGIGAAGSRVASAVSPTMARIGANVRDRFTVRASADGAGPEGPGAVAAAEQWLANQANRGGRSIDDLRQVLQQHEADSLFYGGGPRGSPGASYAQNRLALVDLDESMQRAAGSLARQYPEAQGIGDTFQRARQTGITPTGRQLHEGAGLPTRNPFARVAPEDVAGQDRAVLDALRRAQTLEAETFHQHMNTGRRTVEEIADSQRTAANSNYSAAFKAGEGRGADIQAAIARVAQETEKALIDEAAPVQQAVRRLIEQFKSVRTLQAFDNNKQFLLDSKIENLLNKVSGRGNKHFAGVLTDFKNQMLKAVDDIPGMGPLYSDARAAFSTSARMQNAYKAGLEAPDMPADVAIAAFRALPTKAQGQTGEQKMFHLGTLDHYRDASSRMKTGADRLAYFRTPNREAFFGGVLPRSETATGRQKIVGGELAPFADRPERFGRWLQGEQRMIDTRDITRGGSMTARNLADDEASNSLQTIGETFQRLRQGGTVSAMVVNGVADVLHKMFGMRADQAAAAARMLFTADPVQLRLVLRNIEMRMGKNRFEQFQRYMTQYQASIAGTIGRTPTGMSEP